MQQKKGYILRRVAEQNILLSEQKTDFDAIVVLNETGAFLWELLKQPQEPEQLVRQLRQEYDVDADTALRHVTEFTNKLKELGVLE